MLCKKDQEDGFYSFSTKNEIQFNSLEKELFKVKRKDCC
jgi:hypothetical protein